MGSRAKTLRRQKLASPRARVTSIKVKAREEGKLDPGLIRFGVMIFRSPRVAAVWLARVVPQASRPARIALGSQSGQAEPAAVSRALMESSSSIHVFTMQFLL